MNRKIVATAIAAIVFVLNGVAFAESDPQNTSTQAPAVTEQPLVNVFPTPGPDDK